MTYNLIQKSRQFSLDPCFVCLNDEFIKTVHISICKIHFMLFRSLFELSSIYNLSAATPSFVIFTGKIIPAASNFISSIQVSL
ncbi:hypothetical protein ACVWYG_001627 [Pedobacter sp. UYEF25]